VCVTKKLLFNENILLLGYAKGLGLLKNKELFVVSNIFNFIFNEEANICFIKQYGKIDLAVLKKRRKAIGEDFPNKTNVRLLIDLRDCHYVLTTEDLRVFAEEIEKSERQRGRYNEAVIIDDKLGHGLVRTLSGLRNKPESEYQIFQSATPDLRKKILNWFGDKEEVVFPDFLDL